jgi:ParB family chromosome partitioning protein
MSNSFFSNLIKNNEGLKQISYLSVDKLQPGKYQPRLEIHAEGINALAQSIKKQGILQPLLVREIDTNKYEIIAGERRYTAAKIINLDKVPVVVFNVSNENALEIALIENLQRENLNPIEEAISIQRLQKEFSLSQEDVALKLGKKRSTVANLLRVIKLTQTAQDYLKNGLLTLGHAKLLLKLEEKQQIIVTQDCVKKGFSVSQLDAYIKSKQIKPENKNYKYGNYKVKLEQNEKVTKVIISLPNAEAKNFIKENLQEN